MLLLCTPSQTYYQPTTYTACKYTLSEKRRAEIIYSLDSCSPDSCPRPGQLPLDSRHWIVAPYILDRVCGVIAESLCNQWLHRI